jgi:hypothetical protein
MIKPELSAPAYTNRFEFRPGDVRRYAHPEDAEIHIFPAWGWVSTILYVKDVDYSTRTVYVEENSNASEELRIGNRYYVSNVREELDAAWRMVLRQTHWCAFPLAENTKLSVSRSSLSQGSTV